MSPDAIKTLVKKLRKKLPEDRIKNVVAIGYRLH
jgi:DNA-binding response OmpR family regulator